MSHDTIHCPKRNGQVNRLYYCPPGQWLTERGGCETCDKLLTQEHPKEHRNLRTAQAAKQRAKMRARREAQKHEEEMKQKIEGMKRAQKYLNEMEFRGDDLDESPRPLFLSPDDMMMLYNGRLEDAEVIEKKAEERGIVLPRLYWDHCQHIKKCRERFLEGDQFALLEALSTCLGASMPIPIWVQKGFVRAYRRIAEYEANSWDDVLGPPHKKGIHLAAERKKREMMISVYLKVQAIKEKKPSAPIDDELFKSVGEEFSIGKTLAKEYYYAMKKHLSPWQARSKNSHKTE